MNSNIITSVLLNDNEELVQYKKKRANRPNFYMVGNGTMNKHKIGSIDLIDELTKMSKNEQKVIIRIKNMLTYDNPDGEVYIRFNKDEKQLQKKFLEGFKLLKEKHLVRRTKQSHYIINPNALIPVDYEKAIQLWDSLKDS